MDFRKMLIAGLGALLIFYLFREPPAPDYKKKFNASIETVIKLENEELVRQNHDPIVRKETGIEVSGDGDWIELYYDTPLLGDERSVYQKQGDRYVRVTDIETVSDQLDKSDTTYIENLGIK